MRGIEIDAVHLSVGGGGEGSRCLTELNLDLGLKCTRVSDIYKSYVRRLESSCEHSLPYITHAFHIIHSECQQHIEIVNIS